MPRKYKNRVQRSKRGRGSKVRPKRYSRTKKNSRRAKNLRTKKKLRSRNLRIRKKYQNGGMGLFGITGHRVSSIYSPSIDPLPTNPPSIEPPHRIQSPHIEPTPEDPAQLELEERLRILRQGYFRDVD